MSYSTPSSITHASKKKDLWNSWSNDVFREAQKEQKPLFLLIIQDSYWSRVMQRQLLQSQEAQHLLSTAYIPIRIHAAEYPDVASFFSKFLKLASGRTGWPLLFFLSPQGYPLLGSTYLPLHDHELQVSDPQKSSSSPRFGLLTRLKTLARHWNHPQWRSTNKKPLEWIEKLSDFSSSPTSFTLSFYHYEQWMIRGVNQWTQTGKSNWGSDQGFPKFPLPLVLNGIVGAWNTVGDSDYLRWVESAVEEMICGGIYDHVGGGIFRYSFDTQWMAPCFEKQLVDQCELACVLMQLYQITRKPIYKLHLKEAIELLLNEFRIKDQGFSSRVGIDDQGFSRLHQSTFHYYTWTKEEINTALDPVDAHWVIESFALNQALSAFEILHNQGDVQPTSSSVSSPLSRKVLSLSSLLDDREYQYWSSLRQTLYEHRKTRQRIYRPNKQICTHNALALLTLVQASIIANEPHWLDEGQKIARFLCKSFWNGKELVRSIEMYSTSKVQGCLEDYMSLSYALSLVYDCTEDGYFARQSAMIFEAGHKYFKDHLQGGYFHSPPDRRSLLSVAEKPVFDGIESSGMGWTLFALVKLYQREKDSFYLDEIEDLCKHILSSSVYHPAGCSTLINALSLWSSYTLK